MKFSIIIPVYNVAPYLRECLDSALAAASALSEKRGVASEKCGGVEIICVDDGSTDGSGAILDEYVEKDSRLCVIHQANTGVSAARNAALEVAQGDWVLFLDGDDVLRPDSLEQCARAIEAYPAADLVHFESCRYFDVPDWGVDTALLSVRELDDEIDASDFDTFFTQYLYSRKVVGKIQFEGFIAGEDLLFMLMSLCRAKVIARTDAILYGYRQREGSAVHKAWNTRKLKDELMFRVRMFEEIDKSGRRFSKVETRLQGLMVTESYITFLRTMTNSSHRAIVWAYWFDLLPRFARRKDFTPWCRFVCWMCAFSRSRLIAIILCAAPHWLKTKGFHR